MKKAHFTDSQIMAILKQAEAGIPVTELCREYGMSNATFYKWRSRFGGTFPLNTSRYTGAELVVTYWPDKTCQDDSLQLTTHLDA